MSLPEFLRILIPNNRDYRTALKILDIRGVDFASLEQMTTRSELESLANFSFEEKEQFLEASRATYDAFPFLNQELYRFCHTHSEDIRTAYYELRRRNPQDTHTNLWLRAIRLHLSRKDSELYHQIQVYQ